MTTSVSETPPRPERKGPAPNFHSQDPYAVLGLTCSATAREIKSAYFALVRDHPPEEQPDTFKLIRAAYEKLRAPDAKSETDLFLFQPPYAWTPRKRLPRLALGVSPQDVAQLLKEHGDLGRTDFKADYRPIKA